jgi:hypothetical protein
MQQEPFVARQLETIESAHPIDSSDRLETDSDECIMARNGIEFQCEGNKNASHERVRTRTKTPVGQSNTRLLAHSGCELLGGIRLNEADA